MSPVSSFDQLQSSGTDQTLSEGAPDAGVPAFGRLYRGSGEAFSRPDAFGGC